MAPRPNWKGYLKLSLVSCPVAMFNAATAKDKVAFHLLNRATGHRLRRQMIDPETGEAVESDDQVHGYEASKGEYLVVDDEEIEAVAIESSHTIDVDQFVLRSEISDVYLDTPYYIAPDGKQGEEAFAVIREAMRRRKMAGLARVVLARRERVVMLEPRGRGLVATTLRYPYEIKAEKDILGPIAEVEVGDELLDLAEHIIDTKVGSFDPSRFKDRYEQALLDLIKAKQAGRTPKASAAPEEASNVIDLMEALRRSVGGAPASAAKAAASKPKAKTAASKTPATKTPATKTAAGKALAKAKAPRKKAS